jgi:prefoldin subunit 5
MVMSIPFLAGAAAMIFSILNASITQSTTAVDARHRVWKLRDPSAPTAKVVSPAYDATHPLALSQLAKSTSGMISGTVQDTASVYIGFGNQRNCASKAALIARTWDHRNYQGFAGDAPHFDVLKAMAIDGWEDIKSLTQLTDLSLDLLKDALSGLTDSALDAINDGTNGLDEIAKQIEEEKQKILEAIEKLEQELEKLQNTLEGLERDLDKLTDDLDKALDEEKRLRDLGLPIPDELQKTISSLKGAINDLKKKISDVKNDIAGVRESIGHQKELLDTLLSGPNL